MPITKAEAQGVTRAFVRDYPGALELAYKFREDAADLVVSIGHVGGKNISLTDEQRNRWLHPLLRSINAIASGMRNTG